MVILKDKQYVMVSGNNIDCIAYYFTVYSLKQTALSVSNIIS
jgi:hypothetical protein